MIISNNRPLLEQRLQESVPWGLIVIHGGRSLVHSMVDAIQNNRPLICIKYTGGATDQMCEMLERVTQFQEAKKKHNDSDLANMKPFKGMNTTFFSINTTLF